MRSNFFYILAYCLLITSCSVSKHLQKTENAALIRGKTGSGENYISYLFNNNKKITSNDKKNNPQPKNLCVFSISSFFSVFTL